MKNLQQDDSNTFSEHKALDKTAYPNDFIDFLGGNEALNKIDIFGHRILFCVFEMLKSLQVFSPKNNEIKEILHDELIIDIERGRISSLREIRDEEIKIRKQLEIGKKLAIIEENYFAGNFKMLQFIIPTKALNDYGNIEVKSNKVFHNQLELFKTIGKHKVLSNNEREELFSSLIHDAIYEVGGSYIRIYMSPETARILLNNSNGYAEVYRNIVFKTKSIIPITFYLFLKRKFGKLMSGDISISNLVEALKLPQYCLTPSKLKQLLDKTKQDLNKLNNISFGYKIIDKQIYFKLYETPHTIGIDLNVTSDSYKAKNALKYIKKVRNLKEEHYNFISKKFDQHGYEKMQRISSKQISNKIQGDEYYKWFITRCIQEELM